MMRKSYCWLALMGCCTLNVSQAQTTESYFQAQGLSLEDTYQKINRRAHDPLSVYDLAVRDGISSWMLADMYWMRSSDVFNYFSNIGRDLSKLEDKTPLLSITFENFDLGEYSESALKAAFKEQLPTEIEIDFLNLQGRAEIVSYAGNKVLKITHLTGLYDKKNGLQLYLKLGEQHELILRYQLFFDAAFDFKLGGKLPGLAGKPQNSENPTGGRYTDIDQGFSARDMYLAEGRGINYLYHQDKPSHKKALAEADKLKKQYYGEQLDLKNSAFIYYFPRAEVLNIEHYVRINTPNIANGELRHKVQNHTKLHYLDKVFSQAGDYKINRLFIDFFHGGKGEQYNPQQDSVIYIDNLRLDRPLRTDFNDE